MSKTSKSSAQMLVNLNHLNPTGIFCNKFVFSLGSAIVREVGERPLVTLEYLPGTQDSLQKSFEGI